MKQPKRHLDSPSYWFCVLEIARERNDYERAALAVRELRRLGVTIRFATPKREAANA